MRSVLLVAIALLAVACLAPASPTDFLDTLHQLVDEGRITGDLADQVAAAYRQSRTAPAWWQPLLADTWSMALTLVGAVLWIRYAPAKLGGRGVPEPVRQQRHRG